MEKEFIPYEQALALKELEFDEPCFGKYLSSLQSDWKVYELILEMGMNEEFEDNRNVYFLEGACSAPTYSQAFRWFREKYKLHSEIRSYTAKYFTIVIQECKDIVIYIEYGGIDLKFKTYEEAELACLIKLIEIVKEK
jgi:hypothetical protein